MIHFSGVPSHQFLLFLDLCMAKDITLYTHMWAKNKGEMLQMTCMMYDVKSFLSWHVLLLREKHRRRRRNTGFKTNHLPVRVCEHHNLNVSVSKTSIPDDLGSGESCDPMANKLKKINY